MSSGVGNSNLSPSHVVGLVEVYLEILLHQLPGPHSNFARVMPVTADEIRAQPVGPCSELPADFQRDFAATAALRRRLQALHPDSELAPRDVVARCIARQMASQEGKPVLLDAARLEREKGNGFLATRFPSIEAIHPEQVT